MSENVNKSFGREKRSLTQIRISIAEALTTSRKRPSHAIVACRGGSCQSEKSELFAGKSDILRFDTPAVESAIAIALICDRDRTLFAIAAIDKPFKKSYDKK